MKPAIVIIAYNRDEPLARLLRSLDRADYAQSGIPLVISIDRSDNEKVLKTAQSFEWRHGVKTVVERQERLGLKKHVLLCSDLAVEYGSAIILEDDLYVAADFYAYSCAMLEASESDGRIAGVSLYNHRLNVHAREPFEAIGCGGDNWFFQFASSWGQAYTAAQWSSFREWLSSNDLTPFPESIPENVRSWGESSWLKYFIRYCVEKDKYFIYPTLSRTTNFSDAGTHSMGRASELSVPLRMKERPGCFLSRQSSEGSHGAYLPGQASHATDKTSRESEPSHGIDLPGQDSHASPTQNSSPDPAAPGAYRFTPLDSCCGVYDAWFENAALKDMFEKETVIDLYGKKTPPASGYFLSSRLLPRKRIKSYGRILRPLDANIFEDIPGEDFFLYDMETADTPPKANSTDRLFYNYRAFKAKYGIQMALRRLCEFRK